MSGILDQTPQSAKDTSALFTEAMDSPENGTASIDMADHCTEDETETMQVLLKNALVDPLP